MLLAVEMGPYVGYSYLEGRTHLVLSGGEGGCSIHVASDETTTGMS